MSPETGGKKPKIENEGDVEAELTLRLRYPEGWKDILEAPDAVDYQMWIEELVATTQEGLRAAADTPEWAEDPEAVRRRWQGAIELIADAAIDPDEIGEMSQPEIVETALLTLQANVDSLDWVEEGVAFEIPNLFTGEPVTVDLRNLPEVEDAS